MAFIYISYIRNQWAYDTSNFDKIVNKRNLIHEMNIHIYNYAVAFHNDWCIMVFILTRESEVSLAYFSDQYQGYHLCQK